MKDPLQHRSTVEDDSTGISVEEQRAITDQIDRLMADNRIEVTPQSLVYKPRRNGALLPLLSNVVVLSAAVVAVLVISWFLNRQEKSFATTGTAILTAESKLIAALKQESSQQLRQRDRTIVDAQNRLTVISREKEKLRGQADSMIRAREQELKDEFDRNLAAERERLQNQGVAASSIEQRMKAFQESEKKQLEQELADSRKKAEADLADQQQALAALEARYEQELEAARQERVRLEDEAKQRQADLQKQYDQKTRQAEGEEARVAAEMARLRGQQEQDRLVMDQLIAGYTQVNESLQAREFDKAREGLGSLRKLLDDASIASLPTVESRRTVEVFLIGSLEELVKDREGAAQPGAAAPVQTSTVTDDVAALVREGDELSRSGDGQGARRAYEAAMAKVPPVAAAYGKLQDLRRSEAAAGMRQANVFYQAGSFQAAIDRYQQTVAIILNDKVQAKLLTDSLARAGYRLFAADDLAQAARLKTNEQKRQEVNARLRDIRAQYKAYVALVPKSASTDSSSSESLATLLQARILLRQVLDSEPVRAQYPDLAAKTERYLDAVSAKAREDGRKEALDGMDILFGKLQTGDKLSASSLAPIAVGGERDPVLRLLDRLQATLQ